MKLTNTNSTQPAAQHNRVPVGVHGASGTTGAELVRLLARHPAVELVFASSRQHAGRSLAELEPGAPELELDDMEQADRVRAELVFLCLPHGHSAAMAERCVAAGARVIDLSGDLRLKDPVLHARVYGSPRSEALAARAVYGLTELTRDAVRGATLVANPGCYPTCSTLALAPLASAGLVPAEGVVIDAKSGVSGAGRAPTPTTHFCSADGDVRPYKVGRTHRHVAEIEQILAGVAPDGAPRRVVFSPHLVPLERGMLATIVLPVPPGVTAGDARQLIAGRYQDEPFVTVLPAERAARIRAAVRTNRAVISVHPVEGLSALVLASAIDNLVKGAAGQAIQNMNVMLGLDETSGLPA